MPLTRHFCLYAAVSLICLLFSCGKFNTVDANTINAAPPPVVPPVLPLAILQAGEYPLWFQFTGEGPVLIETITEACLSAALIPWPLAPHVRFMLAHGEDLLMAVNRDGFICLSPREGGQAALYRFSGGEFWQQYTVGAFVILDEKPAALLYRDDRFFTSDAFLPSPRLWTFNLHTTALIPLALPLLDSFAPEDGWDIDALRAGGDGYWYFRALRKTGSQRDILMLRSGDPGQKGEPVSRGAFQNAALPEPLTAAPETLRDMLSAVFARSGCGIAAVVSPEFQTMRSFAVNRERAALMGFYAPGHKSFLAIQPQGAGFYLTGNEDSFDVQRISLPPLPEGFVYTGIGMIESTLIAVWEEQDGYSIGAAGFMLMKPDIL